MTAEPIRLCLICRTIEPHDRADHEYLPGSLRVQDPSPMRERARRAAADALTVAVHDPTVPHVANYVADAVLAVIPDPAEVLEQAAESYVTVHAVSRVHSSVYRWLKARAQTYREGADHG